MGFCELPAVAIWPHIWPQLFLSLAPFALGNGCCLIRNAGKRVVPFGEGKSPNVYLFIYLFITTFPLVAALWKDEQSLFIEASLWEFSWIMHGRGHPG